MDLLQQQASQDEVLTYLDTGMWPWDDPLPLLFLDAIQKNNILRTDPDDALRRARTLYNQTIMKQILSWKAREGQFLLSGAIVNDTDSLMDDDGEGTFGIESGLISKEKNVVRCGTNGMPVLSLGQGSGGSGGSGIGEVEIDPSILPSLVQGFQFVSSVCNPCVALNDVPDYSCPFTLRNDSDKITSIWKLLWF